jgi:hypothetical protein
MVSPGGYVSHATLTGAFSSGGCVVHLVVYAFGYGCRMTQEVGWTREIQANTLAGISIVREAQAGGPEYAVPDAMREIVERLQLLGEPTDADGLARLLTGVVNLSCSLLNWIEADAANKQILLEKVRQLLPDFEEPGTYPTDPAWSTWMGVLRRIEQSVKDVPLSD